MEDLDRLVGAVYCGKIDDENKRTFVFSDGFHVKVDYNGETLLEDAYSVGRREEVLGIDELDDLKRVKVGSSSVREGGVGRLDFENGMYLELGLNGSSYSVGNDREALRDFFAPVFSALGEENYQNS